MKSVGQPPATVHQETATEHSSHNARLTVQCKKPNSALLNSSNHLLIYTFVSAN